MRGEQLPKSAGASRRKLPARPVFRRSRIPSPFEARGAASNALLPVLFSECFYCAAGSAPA